MSMITKVENDLIRIASISPDAEIMFVGEVPIRKGKYSTEGFYATQYGDHLTINHIKNIIAMRDFLNELIDLYKKTPCEIIGSEDA